MEGNTTVPSYWLNWRFLLCAIWISIGMLFSALLIWRYEGRNRSKYGPAGNQQEAAGCLYEGDASGTCSDRIHPVWLLAFRFFAASTLLALILADALKHGVGIFYFYTQWTFTLVTIYFLLGSSLSVHGCLHYWRKVDMQSDRCVGTDAEQGTYATATLLENAEMPNMSRRSSNHGDESDRKIASSWGYALQIIFQTCAGAVALTDIVFWLVLARSYRLTFLRISMHSVNAVFLLGDAILNRLRFPFFRIAYFVLWTCTFVLVQWTIHSRVSMSWPYQFLDLSSPYAPLWYLGVGLLHFPCFGISSLVFKIKQWCFSRIEISSQ